MLRLLCVPALLMLVVSSPVLAAAIGSYNAGCQTGARALPAAGQGYYLVRPERGRHFAQPQMIDYLETLALRARQAGLDADLWLRPDENGQSLDMVDHRHYRLTRHFGDAQHRLIALAAQDARVSRLFVHPLLKQALCRHYGEADWLSRVRPWFGHSSHLHVRLHCPPGEAECEPQGGVPAGSGCGDELTSWIKDRSGAPATTPPPRQSELPAACRTLLANQEVSR